VVVADAHAEFGIHLGLQLRVSGCKYLDDVLEAEKQRTKVVSWKDVHMPRPHPPEFR
jgi:hypothetical protein